ncbi:MAG: prolyl-tRNA synthetase associated domain-containing protein, partial [Clostridiales bacterium]
MEISPIYHNSRPEGELPAQETAAFDFLDSLGIDYERVTHELADTMEKCDDVSAVLGVDVCKNLFLCNRQKTS